MGDAERRVLMTSGRMPGLGTPTRVIPRRRRLRLSLLLPAAVVLLLAATWGSGVVLDAHGDSSPEGLATHLAEIEQELDGRALLPTVTPHADGTWGTIRGDFVGTRLRLERSLPDLGRLVDVAGDASGPVAQAVGDVARGYRLLHEAYAHFEAYEEATLAIVQGSDSDLTVEEARGHAEIGMRLALNSLDYLYDGYRVLRDADATVEHRALFEQRYDEVERAAAGDGKNIRTLLSTQSSQVLVPVERFNIGTGRSAQSVQYTCVERHSYLAERPAEAVPPALDANGTEPLTFPDCPELDLTDPTG
jgi:hypothetical protein